MIVLRLREVYGTYFILFPESHASEQIVSLQTDGQLILEKSLLYSDSGSMERKKFHCPLVATAVKVNIR